MRADNPVYSGSGYCTLCERHQKIRRRDGMLAEHTIPARGPYYPAWKCPGGGSEPGPEPEPQPNTEYERAVRWDAHYAGEATAAVPDQAASYEADTSDDGGNTWQAAEWGTQCGDGVRLQIASALTEGHPIAIDGRVVTFTESDGRQVRWMPNGRYPAPNPPPPKPKRKPRTCGATDDHGRICRARVNRWGWHDGWHHGAAPGDTTTDIWKQDE